jgi:hypothetical protein
MIKIRLLKSRTSNYAQLLESTSIPDIETTDDLYIVARTVGRLLKTYTETLKDPNIVQVLLDESIKEWNASDLQSVQLDLSNQGFDLLITQEQGEDVPLTEGNVKYIMVDTATRDHGVLAYGYTQMKTQKEAVDQLAIIDVIQMILSEFNYFSKTKFLKNPVQDCINDLIATRKVLGTINNYAMTKLSRMLNKLGKTIYAVTLS